MKRYAILVAGGKGLRFGGEVPKQFLPVKGRPVLMRTIDAFIKAIPDISIVMTLPPSQRDRWWQLCREYSFDVSAEIADGGETRFHSVQNALARIPDGKDAVVGVHDGVRPFVSLETIQRCYDTAEKRGSAVPVVPVVETVRMIEPDGTSKTVDRNQYRLVQTPQTFRLDVLKKAYNQPFDPFFTDDASVVEKLGYPVILVDGNRENIKITTPSDLLFAENLCKI